MGRCRFTGRSTLVALAVAVTGVAGGVRIWTWPHPAGVAAASTTLGTDRSRTVSVVGEGDAAITPTNASAQLGVAVHRPTVREAFDRAATEMSALVSAVRGQGVAAADIQTIALQVTSDNSNGRVTGYVVTSSANVMIRRLESAPAVISAATDAAGNDVQVQGVSFGEVPDAATIETARRAAMDAARAQAGQWARLAGRHLGEIISVTEAAASQQPCAGCGGAGPGTGSATAVPLFPGVAHVSQVVTVVFALTD